MVGGQVVDVQSEGKRVDLDTLYYIHTRKTGALIISSVKAGALLSGAGEDELKALSSYAGDVGFAFQIADDILNVEGDRKMMGKDTGSDADRGKVTFPGLMGIEASRQKAKDLVQSALLAIRHFDHRADPLRMIAEFVVERRS
jgi:geranylgeranyl diphosphate synthase type II